MNAGRVVMAILGAGMLFLVVRLALIMWDWGIWQGAFR